MSVRLPERVGRARAKELMFTSRRLNAIQACEIGLVDHCVPDEQLDERVSRLCDEILANSRGTNRIVKALLADGDSRSRPAALVHERLRPYGRPEDMAERMQAGRRPG